jgi:methylated-DNA-[protein]-cysteine S-methyltransferase
MLRYSTMDTPAGPFTLVVAESGAVRAAGFTAQAPELLSLIHPALVEPVETADDVGPAQAAVRAYFGGDLLALDSIEVEQRTSGQFLGHAWQVMREIKPGDPVTYSRYAELAGRPAAIRAAAAACARNAVALIVPCHRVFRTDGSLGGYRWGLPVKTWLLAHESAS